MVLIIIFIFIVFMFLDIWLQKRNSKIKGNFNKIIDSLNIVIWEYNKDNSKLQLSDNYKNIFGLKARIYSLEELYSFICREDVDYIKSFFDEIIENVLEEKFTLEFAIINDKGDKVNIECSGKGKVRNNVFIISGTFIDTTEKVQQENMLRRNEKKYRRALEGSRDIMFYIRLKDNFIRLDDKISNLMDLEWRNEYSFSLEEWLRFTVREEREENKDKFYEFLNSNNKYLNLEYRIKTKNGKIIWLKMKGKRISEENGDYIYGTISDDTDRKEKELKINYMSYFDAVTGVPNRRYFVEHAEEMKNTALLNKKKFAVIFIDLDNFKYVNDTYGHSIGDVVLKLFCKKVNNKLQNKHFLARFGGDEFVAALENINEAEVICVINEILGECNIPLNINNKEIYTTVSIGVSICSDRNESIQTLLKKADIAMYKAKSTGKNRYMMFNKELAEKMDREIELSRCIRKSIENNEIYFIMQPKYWAKTERIQGFEVLTRWQSKELGIVSPNEFIPTAEYNGFIVEMGKFLIKDSFKKCKLLNNMIGSNFKIAVNLSEVQIRDENLIDFIKKSMDEEEINPKNIEFEVTESIIMTSVQNNIKVLEKLRELGVSIVLDDFGTGYSSMNYLRKLPIDTVKIDKSFIYDIGKDFKGECIIEKIVELCHLLNLEVTAEGVENKEQIDFLNSIDCDIIQGYYFSEPKTFNEVIELIK